MITTPIKTRIFREGEDLVDFIREHVAQTDFWEALTLAEWDILVITSKIVALSEKRTFIAKDQETKKQYIKKESSFFEETKHVCLTLKDGMLMANAGIDESNGDGKCILLPENSYNSAFRLWKSLRESFWLRDLGIIITDSHTARFRKGTIAISLWHMGFSALRDYQGKRDLFGRSFHFSRVNVVDCLATSAAYVMGEWDECQPLAIIRDAGVSFTDEKQDNACIHIDIADDMYTPLYMRNIK